MHKLMDTQQYILNDEWATKEIKKIKKFPELNKIKHNASKTTEYNESITRGNIHSSKCLY